MLDSAWSAFRQAVRELSRNRSFAALAIASIALGIGANTAVFSAVDAVLLREPPFEKPAQLHLIWSRSADQPDQPRPLSFPNFSDVRTRARTLQAVGAWSAGGILTFTGCGAPRACGDGPLALHYAGASANLFSVLGVRLAQGSDFDPAAEQPGSGDRSVIISDELRARIFGSTDGLGASLLLDGTAFTVRGVLPPGFAFGAAGRAADVWFALGAEPGAGNGNRSKLYARGVSYLGVVARALPSATQRAIDSDMDRIAKELRQEYPGPLAGLSFDSTPLREQLVQDRRTTLLVLLAAVGVLLLLCCTNVANLMIARSSARHQDLAIRRALGATRLRLLAEQLAESLLIAAAGAGIGLIIARWSIDLLASISPVQTSPFVPYAVDPWSVTLNTRVLAFTLVASLLSALLFTIAPALRATHLSEATLTTTRATAGPGALQLRRALITGEIAAAVLLLLCATAFLRSLLALTAPGNAPDVGNAVVAEVTLSPARYGNGERTAAFYAQVTQQLLAQPDVFAAGAVDHLPLSGRAPSTDFRIAGRTPPSGREWIAQYATATPGYHAAAGIRVLRGRAFAEADVATSERVALVNAAFARRFWPDTNPIGQQVGLSFEALRFSAAGPPTIDFQQAYRTVVGVVEDVRQDVLTEDAQPLVYIPHTQHPAASMAIVARAVSTSAAASALRTAVATMDPMQPLERIEPLAATVQRAAGQDRYRTLLISMFATLAIGIAVVGTYGLLMYSVGQRRREIGIRTALGARSGDIAGLIGGEAIRMALVGVTAGTAAGLLVLSFSRALLYRTPIFEPISGLAVIAGVVAVVIASAAVPVRRALSVDAINALKSE